MKKIVSLFFCVCLLATLMMPLSACATGNSSVALADVTPTAVPAAAGEPAAAPAATPIPIMETAPVRASAYGEQMELTADHDGFSGTILYPIGGIEDINTAIATWANETYTTLEKQTAAVTATDANGIKGTMHVDYDSYEYANRFVGIKEYGVYAEQGKNASELIVYTYNYDLAQNKQMALNNVIAAAHIDAVAALVTERLKVVDAKDYASAAALTANDLNNFVVRPDGVEWLFSGSDGVVSVLVDYTTLASYLCLLDPVATAAPTAVPAAVDKPAIEQTAVCIHNGSHVRAEATQDSALIDTISANTELEVIKSNAVKGWHKIWYKDQVAYIYGKLVRLASQPQTSTGWVESNTLHVRAEASTKSEILGTLKYQDKVEVVQKDASGKWDKIWYNDAVAYVYAKYIHVGSRPVNTPKPEEATPEPQYQPKQIDPRIIGDNQVSFTAVGTCTTNGVIVRSERNSNSDYYGKLGAGVQVYIIEQGSSWDKVFVHAAHQSGYVGYVHAKYISVEVIGDNPALVSSQTA